MNNNFEIEHRFWITCKGEPVFGKGKIELLLKIKELGSLRKAAQNLGISYRKAYYGISQINKACDEPVVNMQRGGKDGGNTQLTPYGLTLIEAYIKLSDSIKRFMQQQKFEF